MNHRLLALRPYPMARLNSVKDDLRRRGVRIFDFGTGDPIEPTDPGIRDACTRAVPEVSQYPRVRGSGEVRRAFADWFRTRFGVGLDPDSEVLPAQGSKEAIFHLPLVLLDPARAPHGVLYPEPGYPVYEIGTLFAHGEPIALRLTADNGYLMDPDAVGAETLARCALVWLCYPHNPTGTDLPEALWRKWLRARERHGFVLASDECYTELWFGSRPRSLLEFGRKNCLVFHSLSKRSGMTGYRSAVIAGDAELVQLYARFREGMGLAMPVWTEAASAAAWRDEGHVAARRLAFARKRDLFLQFLAARGFTVWPASSTFYLWLKVPAGHTDESYALLLLERGIVVSPGSFFGPGNADWIRLALVPDLEGCRAAIAAWPVS